MECPVCGNQSDKSICEKCGYALNMDLLNYQFLNKLTKEEIEDYKKQITIHKKLYLKSLESSKNKTIQNNPKIKLSYTDQEKEIAQQYFIKGTNCYKNQNYLSAIDYFTKSAENGKGLSYFYLGLIYRYGKGVPENYKRAFEYYELSTKLDCTIGYKEMGDMYFRGEGVESNIENGLEMYNQAILKNDEWAIYQLGTKYYFGCGVLRKDYTKARELFEKDISRNNPISISYNMLADIYEQGLGVKKDLEKANQYREHYKMLNNYI